MQDVYAAEMLFVIANAFAKASLVCFIMAISPQRRIKLASYTMLAIIAGWAIAGVFALAFQCDLPHPWLFEQGKCINQEALSIFIGVVNILTDVALIAIPWAMMWWVQTSTAKKWQVMVLFGTRIMYVPDEHAPKMSR